MGMLDRENKIIEAMKNVSHLGGGRVKASYLALVTDMSKTEVNRGLNDLIEKGKVVREGRHTHTTYTLVKLRPKSSPEDITMLLKKNGLEEDKKPGRPKKDPQDLKQKRHVRVSDADMELIQEHGFTVQSLLDQAIGSLRPIDESDLKKLDITTLKAAFSPKGI